MRAFGCVAFVVFALLVASAIVLGVNHEGSATSIALLAIVAIYCCCYSVACCMYRGPPPPSKEFS